MTTQKRPGLEVRATLSKLTPGASTGYGSQREVPFTATINFKVPKPTPVPTFDKWYRDSGVYGEDGRQLEDAIKKAAKPPAAKKTAAKKAAKGAKETKAAVEASSGNVNEALDKMRARLRARYEQEMERVFETNRKAMSMGSIITALMMMQGSEVDVTLRAVQADMMMMLDSDPQALLSLPSGE